MLINYEAKYRARGKYIYKPTPGCERRGERVIDFIERRIGFPDYFYHFRRGGHVAALHEHLQDQFFFKIDIQNFFYSIARNRVHRVLAKWGLKGAPTYAKWSTVRSPYTTGPRHVLPIGFRQSPHIASLVLMESSITFAIERARAKGVAVSVYLDDIVGSNADEQALKDAYDDIRHACVEAQLVPNPDKLIEPSKAVVAFNCNLMNGLAEVTQERIAQFYAGYPTPLARQSFEQYVARVAQENSKSGE